MRGETIREHARDGRPVPRPRHRAGPPRETSAHATPCRRARAPRALSNFWRTDFAPTHQSHAAIGCRPDEVLSQRGARHESPIPVLFAAVTDAFACSPTLLSVKLPKAERRNADMPIGARWPHDHRRILIARTTDERTWPLLDVARPDIGARGVVAGLIILAIGAVRVQRTPRVPSWSYCRRGDHEVHAATGLGPSLRGFRRAAGRSTDSALRRACRTDGVAGHPPHRIGTAPTLPTPIMKRQRRVRSGGPDPAFNRHPPAE